jgi:type IV pilus assembly protein PilW
MLGLLLPLMMSNRRVVQLDQTRTAVNQNLRSATDLIGADIRTAGERLSQGSGPQLPALLIVSGAGGAPDELILRRNLSDIVLPVCETLTGNQNNITVVRRHNWPQIGNYPECLELDTDGDGWSDNLQAWRDYAAGGTVVGYIFNPVTGRGQFFEFEVRDNSRRMIHKVAPSAHWDRYNLEDRARIYILEERRYRLADGALTLIINGDEAGAARIAADITDLQARYVMADGSLQDTLPAGSSWRDVRSLEITLTTRSTLQRETVERTLTSRFFPRNVLSR